MAEEGKEPPHYLCHGELNQHHILMGGKEAAIIEFNRMHLGVQAADLYHFIRKVMEKHSWNPALGMRLLEPTTGCFLWGQRRENISTICSCILKNTGSS